MVEEEMNKNTQHRTPAKIIEERLPTYTERKTPTAFDGDMNNSKHTHAHTQQRNIRQHGGGATQNNEK